MGTQSTLPRVARGLDEPDIPEGFQIGEYIVEQKLGQGGFGTVFRARHPLIGKLAAIKILSRKYSADPEIVSRFVSEARAVNQIRHRNIVDIFSFGQLDDGRSYFVMELLDGDPLDKYIRERGGLALGEALPILRAIARALDAAHAKGIAHRDLKPENIMLAHDDDGQLYPKLLDFGIAKLVGDAGFSTKHKTRTGTPIGTPFYMSPEQARGEPVDHRTDVYSFGCVAYEVLTGFVPFDGDNHLAIMMKQCSDEPIPPSVRAAENPALPPLPETIDNTLAWLMQKDASERPASLIEAVNALEEAAGLPSRPTPLPFSRATPVPVSRATPVPGRTTPVPARVTPVPGRKTPTPRSHDTMRAGSASESSRGEAAFAVTMAHDVVSDPDLLGLEQEPAAELAEPAAAPAPAAPRSRRLVWVLLTAIVGVGGAIAGVLVMRDSSSAPTESTNQPVAPPAVATPPPPTPVPTPQAPESRLVTIKIEGAPDGTEVFGPTGPLGRAPGEIQLVQGDSEIQLTLSADGYETKSVKVTPSEDRIVEVTLDEKKKPASSNATASKPKPRPRPKPTPATPKPKPKANPWTRN